MAKSHTNPQNLQTDSQTGLKWCICTIEMAKVSWRNQNSNPHSIQSISLCFMNPCPHKTGDWGSITIAQSLKFVWKRNKVARIKVVWKGCNKRKSKVSLQQGNKVSSLTKVEIWKYHDWCVSCYYLIFTMLLLHMLELLLVNFIVLNILMCA